VTGRSGTAAAVYTNPSDAIHDSSTSEGRSTWVTLLSAFGAARKATKIARNAGAAEGTGAAESAADHAERAQIVGIIEQEIANLRPVNDSIPAALLEDIRCRDGRLDGCSEGSVKTHCSRATARLGTGVACTWDHAMISRVRVPGPPALNEGTDRSSTGSFCAVENRSAPLDGKRRSGQTLWVPALRFAAGGGSSWASGRVRASPGFWLRRLGVLARSSRWRSVSSNLPPGTRSGDRGTATSTWRCADDTPIDTYADKASV